MKKKIIATIIIIFTIINSFFNITANALNVEELDLYAKETLYCFRYKELLTRIEFVVYEHEGKEYPAYCLNRELDGVSVKDGGYTVKIEDLITNELVWKVIINGYPYKTYTELGCNSEIEAFAATKLAAYNMMYNYNLEEFIPVNETGERVVSAIKRLSEIARNSTQVKLVPEITINCESQEWQVDEKDSNYISKVYSVLSKSEVANFEIQLTDIDTTNIKLTDLNNIEKSSFKTNEKFKVMLPIQELSEDGSFKITAKANLKTYPIYYGKAPNENVQNYAIAGFEHEKAEDIYEETYLKNSTELEIIKVDGDTSTGLKDCEFIVQSGDKEYEVITDRYGKITLKNLIPGKYNITEKRALEGYLNNDETLEIELKLNEKKQIMIENYKEPEPPQEEPPQEEPPQEEPPQEEPPQEEPPQEEPPQEEPPQEEPPQEEPPQEEPPQEEPPQEEPPQEAPPQEEPPQEEPPQEEPPQEEPAQEEPAQEEPQQEEPQQEESQQEEPPQEEPVQEEPVKKLPRTGF